MKKPDVPVPGQVWTFPLSDGRSMGFLRVVLNVRDLGLPPGNPLGFVGDCCLVQVSRATELGAARFAAADMLVNGLFLAVEEPWKRSGFVPVGHVPVDVDAIELPCWFSGRSDGSGRIKSMVCRGEFAQLSGMERDAIELLWGTIGLTRRYPSQLSMAISPGPPEATITKRLEIADVRYSPFRDEIAARLDLDLSTPYMELVRVAGRSAAYGRAANPATQQSLPE